MLQPSNEDLGIAFARLQHSLRSYLRRRIADPAQAEDLLQDIFVKALKSKRAGRRVDNLTGWLFTVAKTTLIDYYRATGKPLEPLDENIPGIEADELQLHQEISTCLKTFTEQLSPIYRDTLMATDFRGETMRSLAEAQKVSVSAIKSRAVRGRAMLKEKLLTCCYVEITDGVVTDYHRHAATGCGDRCV